MVSTLSMLMLFACGGGESTAPDATPDAAPEAEAVEAAAEAETASDFDKVQAALATKNPEPRCQDVDKLTSDPVAAYRHVANNVTEPTMVPMRAATCLLQQHPREAEAEALKWVADPNASSLTTVALNRLDTLPADSAMKIAQAALAGPHKDLAKMRIARLRTPELKALVAE